jgi:hypothetical protein
MQAHGRTYVPNMNAGEFLAGHRNDDEIQSPLGGDATPRQVLDASNIYAYDTLASAWLAIAVQALITVALSGSRCRAMGTSRSAAAKAAVVCEGCARQWRFPSEVGNSPGVVHVAATSS